MGDSSRNRGRGGNHLERAMNKIREALREIQRLGEQCVEPNYRAWFAFQDTVTNIAREALASLDAAGGAQP